MRILVLTMWYPNPENWVFGTFVHQQALALRNGGADIRIVQPIPLAPFPINLLRSSYRSWSHIPEHREYEGFDVYHPRYITLPRHLLYHRTGEWMYAGIRDVVLKLHGTWPFDLIHAHTTYPCGYAANAIRDRDLPGVKVIHTVHRYSIEDVPRFSAGCRDLVCRSLIGAEKVVFVSTRGLQGGLAVAGDRIRDTSRYITNGVNPDQFKLTGEDMSAVSGLKKRYGATTNLVFVGYLSRIKGVPELLETMRQLRDSYEPVRLFLVGANRLGGLVDRYIRAYGLQDTVITVGPVPHDHVKRWLRFADIFVLPSHAEGVPTVLFEALYLGVASIFTDVGGIAQVVGNRRHCILIPPKSQQKLFDAIMELIRDPALRARLAREGRRLIREYTWERNAREHLILFRAVLEKPGNNGIIAQPAGDSAVLSDSTHKSDRVLSGSGDAAH